MPGKTIAEKILSTKSGVDARAGDIVVGALDLAVSHDANRPLPFKLLPDMGASGVWDPSRYVVVLDHYPSPTIAVADVHKELREFCRARGAILYDVGEGISHVVVPERGHVAPGDLVIGSDSHTCTYGALGAFSTGVGSSDLAAGLATGRLWFRVPETFRVDCAGGFQPGVSAKDLILDIAGRIGADGATYMALEFHGAAIVTLGMDGRFTLANMAIEVGAKAGLIAPDATTAAWLTGRLRRSWEPIIADPDAEYARTIEIDVARLAPKVALPHAVDQVVDVDAVGEVPVHQVVIGTCTSARLDDLREAARILGGRRIAAGVRLYVVPPSRRILSEALANGILQSLIDSGAIIGTPGCSGCVGGAHFAVPGSGENVVTTANRNYKGRSGNPEASLYLASPATAAASALTGRITDPRRMAGSSS